MMFKTIKEYTTLSIWEFIGGSVLVAAGAFVFLLIGIAVGA